MIKFQNKEGKQVMEISDNGDVTINDRKLEESFKKKKSKEESPSGKGETE